MDRKEINQLFDTVSDEKHMREAAIFEAVYPVYDEAHKKMFYFLHHVDECPPVVIEYCQELLAPKPPAGATV